MSEPCDLTAVEARRLIGARQLSASELLESCIARIESVDHAVNAMVARDFDRARTAAKTADAAVARGDTLAPLHGLPIGIKDWRRPRASAPPTAAHYSATTSPAGPTPRRRRPRRRRHRHRQDQHAGVRRRRQHAQHGLRRRPATRSIRQNPAAGRRRLGGGAGDRHGADLQTAPTPAASLRNPAAFCGIVGFRPTPGLVPTERRGLGWSDLPVVGSDGPHRRRHGAAARAMVGDDAGDPLATTIYGRTVRAAPRISARPRRSTWRGCASR